MAKLSILHLSDIHIGNNIYNKAEDIAIPIIEALEDHNRNVDCIVITGDIFDGRPISTINRKKVAIDFLKYLKKELSLSTEDFIIVPGNHDLKEIIFQQILTNLKRYWKNSMAKHSSIITIMMNLYLPPKYILIKRLQL